MKKKVIIVGAGIAGISAAMELVDNQNCEVTLIEAKSYPGGRIYSRYQPDMQAEIDNGHHIMIGAYHSFFRILKKIGTFDKLHFQQHIDIPFHIKGGGKSHLKSYFQGKAGMLQALLMLNEVSLSSKLKAISFVNKLKSGKIKTDGKSAFELLFEDGQINELFTIFWEPVIFATCNSLPRQASADIFAGALLKGFFAGGDSSKLVFSKVGLSDLILPFIAYHIGNGGKLIFGERIGKIEMSGDLIHRIISKSGIAYEADAYIFALPPEAISKLIPDTADETLKHSADSFGNSTIISGYFIFGKPVTNSKISGLIGTNTQWVFNRNLINESNYDGLYHIATTISAADRLSNFSAEQLTYMITSELRDIFPDINDNPAILSKVIVDKKATPLITPQNYKLRPKAKSKIVNLFIAGDWADTGLPATMESASISGENAARELTQFLQLPSTK